MASGGQLSGEFDVLYVGAGSASEADALAEYAPVSVEYLSEGALVLDHLAEHDPDCVVSEQSLEGISGLEVLHLVRDADPSIPFVLFVSNGSESLASDAISADVTEYVVRTGSEDADIERLAEIVHQSASRYRAEQDVAMLNDLARNVYERVTDAFFAVDRDWRFTYLNEEAEDLLDIETAAVVGENVWEVFPDAVGSTFYTEFHRAMATQEPVTFSEYFSPIDRTLRVRAFPSVDGLSVHFRNVVEDDADVDGEHLLELTSILSYDLIDSVEQAKANVQAARAARDGADEELAAAEEALDRMADLVTHSMRLANEP